MTKVCPPPSSQPLTVYKPSAKHCEPITAQKPGTKCPGWSKNIAQALLNDSLPMGDKRVATRNGLAFVAQMTEGNVWHGYPEAWDQIDLEIKKRWLADGIIPTAGIRDSASPG